MVHTSSSCRRPREVLFSPRDWLRPTDAGAWELLGPRESGVWASSRCVPLCSRLTPCLNIFHSCSQDRELSKLRPEGCVSWRLERVDCHFGKRGPPAEALLPQYRPKITKTAAHSHLLRIYFLSCSYLSADVCVLQSSPLPLHVPHPHLASWVAGRRVQEWDG